MGYSILYKDSDKARRLSLDEKTLLNLRIDSSLSYICNDTQQRNIFLKALMHPLADKNEIVYRQQILDDFIQNVNLCNTVISLFDRFEDLYIMQKSVNKNRIQNFLNNIDSISSAKNFLQSNALGMKRGLLFVQALAKALSEADIHSEGLLRLLDEFRIHTKSAYFDKMILLCSQFENFSIAAGMDIKLTIDDGKISSCKMVAHKYIQITDPDIVKKHKFFKKTRNEVAYPCARLFLKKGDNYEKLIVTAILELSDAFFSFFSQLCNKFIPIREELIFYKVALDYIKTLQEKNISMCFPQLINEKEFVNVENLYDLFLVTTIPAGGKIVSNNMTFFPNEGGALLFGDNGSGKTVFLRSIATMHILAQSGLPVPAKLAEIPVYNQIVTLFAESEKSKNDENGMGRFEQEVQAVAQIVDHLKSNTLVLLNEPFQSTAYNEGADGLYYLLKFFSKHEVRWILVTHLLQLEEKFECDQNVKMLYAISEEYRIMSTPRTFADDKCQ